MSKRMASTRILHLELVKSVLRLADVKFDKMTPEERIGMISALAELGVSQADFFEVNLKKIAQRPSLYRPFTRNLVQSLFSVGYFTQTAANAILAVIKSDNVNRIADDKEFYTIASYLLLAGGSDGPSDGLEGNGV